MRDILQSNKGRRTRSQKDYGRDAGTYVPLLERRPIPRGWVPSGRATVDDTAPALYSVLQLQPTPGRYGRFGALADAQESDAANAVYIADDFSDGITYIARNCRAV